VVIDSGSLIANSPCVVLEYLRTGNVAAEGIDKRIERFPNPSEIKISPKSRR